jgi:hypothetical protein
VNWAHTVATAVVTSCKGCSLDAGRGQGLLACVCAGERPARHVVCRSMDERARVELITPGSGDADRAGWFGEGADGSGQRPK